MVGPAFLFVGLFLVSGLLSEVSKLSLFWGRLLSSLGWISPSSLWFVFKCSSGLLLVAGLRFSRAEAFSVITVKALAGSVDALLPETCPALPVEEMLGSVDGVLLLVLSLNISSWLFIALFNSEAACIDRMSAVSELY